MDVVVKKMTREVYKNYAKKSTNTKTSADEDSGGGSSQGNTQSLASGSLIKEKEHFFLENDLWPI